MFLVPAVPHNDPSKLSTCVFATGLYNMLDYPAGVVPAGIVTKEDLVALNSEDTWPVG